MTSFWRDRPVFVTGATGLLGSWLVPELVNRAYDMRMNAVIQQLAMSLGGTVNYLQGAGSSVTTPDSAAWEYWKRRVSMD